MTWTPELTARLTELWADKKTTSEIRDELGLTRNQVVGKLNRMGLLGNPPNRNRYEERRKSLKTKRKLLLDREPNGWDNRTFQPWEHRKELRKMERERGLPFRAMEAGNELR